MIKFGFNTLAMLTYGLGIRMQWPSVVTIRRRPRVSFKNKPPGIAVEEKTGPTSFEDSSLEFEDTQIQIKDR